MFDALHMAAQHARNSKSPRRTTTKGGWGEDTPPYVESPPADRNDPTHGTARDRSGSRTPKVTVQRFSKSRPRGEEYVPPPPPPAPPSRSARDRSPSVPPPATPKQGRGSQPSTDRQEHDRMIMQIQ
eukprot:10281204-Alexandrium_andersonii.AAC.1